jgi:hypothetical protein
VHRVGECGIKERERGENEWEREREREREIEREIWYIYSCFSGIEKAATYYCAKDACKQWTNQTGIVHIGKPIKDGITYISKISNI